MNEERCDQMDCKTFDSIRIETAGAEDMNEIRKLWKQSFDDQDAYMDYYFQMWQQGIISLWQRLTPRLFLWCI